MAEANYHDIRCFVSASHQADTSLLVRTLKEAGVTAIFVEDIMPVAATTLTSVRQALEKADFVLGVLSEGIDNTTVAFELGMAAALGKPAIAVIPRAVPVPPQLETHVIVRGDMDDSPALRFAVDQLTKNLLHGASHKEQTLPTSLATTLGSTADELVARLNTEIPSTTEQSLVQVLADTFRALGITAVEGTGDARFDLGVWDSELAGLVGNPFVIEVKRRLTGRAHIASALLQVERYLAATGGRWALLVYAEGDELRIADAARSTQVLTTSVHDLIFGLRDIPFAEYVRRMRAARVHGTP